MRFKGSLISALAAAVLAFSGATFAQKDQSVCPAALNAALMTVRTGTTGSKSATAETQWQCSFKFSTHDEAIKAGLDIGAVVYGVPLQVGGKFDKKLVTSWKDENCSQSAKSADFEAATFNYLREAAPGQMKAFSACVEANASTKSVLCEVTEAPLTATVKWRSNDEDRVNPRIRQAIVSGGTCQFNFAKNEKVLQGGTGGPCEATPKTDFAVYFQTDRGSCVASRPYRKKGTTLGGKVVLTAARSIEDDLVTFADGAEVITNGFVFTVVADEIAIAGNARIKSFDGERPGRPPGDNGLSGGTVILQAAEVTGGRLEVALIGESGLQGKSGGKGPTGPAGGAGSGNRWVGLEGCKGAVNGAPGLPGLQGESAGDGGAAGDGGNVVINVARGLKNGAVSRIDVVQTSPGSPGAAGKPGPGGDGGPGGAGGTGSGTCGGSEAGPTGPLGPPGNGALPGKPGKPGTTTFVRM